MYFYVSRETAGNVAVLVMIPQIGEKERRIWAAKKEMNMG